MQRGGDDSYRKVCGIGTSGDIRRNGLRTTEKKVKRECWSGGGMLPRRRYSERTRNARVGVWVGDLPTCRLGVASIDNQSSPHSMFSLAMLLVLISTARPLLSPPSCHLQRGEPLPNTATSFAVCAQSSLGGTSQNVCCPAASPHRRKGSGSDVRASELLIEFVPGLDVIAPWHLQLCDRCASSAHCSCNRESKSFFTEYLRARSRHTIVEEYTAGSL